MNKLVPVVAFIVVLCGTVLLSRFFQAEQKHSLDEIFLGVQDCNPMAAPCSITENGNAATVHFPGFAHALKPFDAEVRIEGDILPAKISISFVMPDMDMGFNVFFLQQVAKQRWHRKLILPVCSMGRNDWVAEARFIYADRVVRADFKME